MCRLECNMLESASLGWSEPLRGKYPLLPQIAPYLSLVIGQWTAFNVFFTDNQRILVYYVGLICFALNLCAQKTSQKMLQVVMM